MVLVICYFLRNVSGYIDIILLGESGVNKSVFRSPLQGLAIDTGKKCEKEQAESIKLPTPQPVNMTALSEEELNAELEKGYADMLEGRTKPARQAFADIRKDYGL